VKNNVINPKFEDLSWDKKHALCLQAVGIARTHYKIPVMGQQLIGDMMAGPQGETGYMKFRLSTGDREHYLLTICYWLADDNVPHITSYLRWLNALAEDTDLQIQTPVLSKSGELVTELTVWDSPTDHFRCFCSVLQWIPGEPMWPRTGLGYKPESETPPERSDGQLREMGQALAILHQHTLSWQQPKGFFRLPRYQVQPTALVEDLKCEGKYTQGLDLVAQAAKVIDRDLDSLLGNPANSGLCHGDPSTSNFVVNEGGVFPIDFDACCEDLFLSDICTAMRCMDPRRRRPLLEGYDLIRPLPEGTERALEVLLMRWLIGEFNKRWWTQNPNSPFYENSHGFWTFICNECERFLSERPILFESSPLEWYHGRLGM